MNRPVFLKTQLGFYFSVSVLLALIPAVLILCIPLINLEGTGVQKMWAYIMAAAFWLCILLELLATRKCSSERRSLEQRKVQSSSSAKSDPGVVSFLKTREGAIADAVMFASLIAVITITWTRAKSQWLVLGCVSVLYLSFNMHCLLNGKNYRYMKLLSNYKKEHEQDE